MEVYLISFVLTGIGVGLIIKGRQNTEQVKENAPAKLVGVACVCFAGSFGSLLVGFFN